MRKILLVIDMQNDFIDGSLGTNEAVKIVNNVINKIKKLITASNIFEKGTFGSVKLVEKIREIAATEDISIEIVGLCTDICVVSNALLIKAYLPEIDITVDSSCCAGVTPTKHEASLETMRSCQINVI